MWMDPANGRWVCVRCFESNEADADRCAKCGLERGADPATSASPSADPGASSVEPQPQSGAPAPGVPARPWTEASQPPSQRPMWLQFALRFWWVGLLAVVGGVAAVQWLGGSRPITDLAAGDCFDIPGATSNGIDDITKRDCTEPHEYEMYFTGDLPDGPFPSDPEITAWVDANCRPAFAEYVGIDPELSALSASYIAPSEDVWNDGDHSVQCALYDESNPELTESLRDAAR